MFDGLTPDLAPRLVLAIGGVGVAFVILVLVLIFLKRRNSPLFIKGGKAREPRLLVLDAAAVDPKRRLVLIRRDEVEHLIMIGGPTDIVIETGITDRARPATARAAAVDPAETARPAQVAESRPRAPASEAATEAVRPVAPAQSEQADASPVATRPRRTPEAAARSAASTAALTEKIAPASERVAQQPPADRQSGGRNVSAAGPMLYGADQDARPAARPTTPEIRPVRTEDVAQPATGRRAQPAASSAEAALEAARDRVLPGRQAVQMGQAAGPDGGERALTSRLDTGRMDAMRRVSSSQPAAQPSETQAQDASRRDEPQPDPGRAQNGEPSDFEKLLEAELDASGVFGGQAPKVRGDMRVSNSTPASVVVPPVRISPASGATPDVTSEEEVARVLGEIAANRKS